MRPAGLRFLLVLYDEIEMVADRRDLAHIQRVAIDECGQRAIGCVIELEHIADFQLRDDICGNHATVNLDLELHRHLLKQPGHVRLIVALRFPFLEIPLAPQQDAPFTAILRGEDHGSPISFA